MNKYILPDGYLEVTDYDDYREKVEVLVHRNGQSIYVERPVVFDPAFDGDYANWESEEGPEIGFLFEDEIYLN